MNVKTAVLKAEVSQALQLTTESCLISALSQGAPSPNLPPKPGAGLLPLCEVNNVQ